MDLIYGLPSLFPLNSYPETFKVVVQSLSCVWLHGLQCARPLSFTSSWSLLRFISIVSMMPSNHFLLCLCFFLLPSIFLSIRVFSSELVLCIKCPKFWSFSFSISPSNAYSGLISFRIEWFDLAVQGTLKSLLQHHNSLKGGKVFYGEGAQKRWNGRGRESWATDKSSPFFWLLQKRQYSLFYIVLNFIVKSILMTLWVVTFILIYLLNCEIPKGKTGFPGSSEGKESACNAGDLALMPWLGRSPGEGNGNPLQYSCLENPTDRGAWWAIVHGVTKSWTRLSD